MARKRNTPSITWSKERCQNRPATKTGLCCRCGGTFNYKYNEAILVKTEQVNHFRGDDEVEFYHLVCDPRPNHPEVKFTENELPFVYGMLAGKRGQLGAVGTRYLVRKVQLWTNWMLQSLDGG